MKKIFRFLLIAQLVCILIYAGMLIADKCALREDLIRLHVVAASDSYEDQQRKLQVRDAVVEQVQGLLAGADNAREAKTILAEKLHTIEQTAKRSLEAAGSAEAVCVSLAEEAFPVRHYETFSLPSGVYNSLRIQIGEGAGKNWWCVVFPSLCIPAVAEMQEDVSAASGFSSTLTGTITGQAPYKISFFLLDCIGKLENLFFS